MPPESWNDLLDPRYKNNLQMADARTSGTATERIYSLVKVMGEDPAFAYQKKLNGKKVFKGWKAPGEPWVRYYGLPTEVEAGLADQHPEYVDYFDKAGKLWKVSDKDGNGETTYYPYSPLNQYMFDKKSL